MKEVSGVLSGLHIVALREVALVSGYVRKTQLVHKQNSDRTLQTQRSTAIQSKPEPLC